MRPPRPHCPNAACEHHRTPEAGFYAKDGYRPVAHGKPIPRYKCRTCGTRFCSTSSSTRHRQHRPDLNRRIFELAVSGVSMTRIARLLECSPETVERKIRLLAIQAKHQHAHEMFHRPSNLLAMDELETFIHARWRQVSVPIVICARTKRILGFGIAAKPSNMKIGVRMGWTIDRRPKVLRAVLEGVRVGVDMPALIQTDQATYYAQAIREALPGVKHKASKTPKGDKTAHNPLFAIDHLFAKLRNDLARLGRKTWITTKTEAALERHLWLYVAWVNRYRMG